MSNTQQTTQTTSTSTRTRFLLVGIGFHPGAATLLAYGLRQGAEVNLVAEPTNPYDPLAVRVEVASGEVRVSDELDIAFFGATGGELGETGFPFTLGHLGASPETKAAKAAKAEGHEFALVRDWHTEGARWAKGRLVFTSTGTTLVECGDEGTGAGK